MTGRCVVMVDKGRVEIQPCDVREPAPGQVLVRADKTLISPGTERALLLSLGEFEPAYPKHSGYSFVGAVEQVGTGVDGFAPGDRVVGQCPHYELVTTDAARLAHVPAALASEEAAFGILLQTALQGVRKARIEIGASVLVVGLGLLGQLAAKLARLDGAVPLLGADLSPARREWAAGACDAVLDPEAPDYEDRVLNLTGGVGPMATVEVTGSPEVIKAVFQLTSRMGRVVLLGSSRGNTDDVNFYRDVHKRGLTVVGAHIRTRPGHERQPGLWPERDEFPLCLDLLARRRVTVTDLITDRYAADDAPAAYQRLADWDDRMMGVVLDWTGQ